MALSVGSLFSGIGGFDLGLERAGMRVLWQCESDPFCRRVLAKHWPHVECHPDIRELAFPNHVDVLCGGFPCQDLSVASKGAGINGARSGLWREYARLIREIRPRYVIVENVPGLLARGMGRVLGDLAACGYDAEWDCLPASAFGAPHRRDRIWLVAYPQSIGRDWWGRVESPQKPTKLTRLRPRAGGPWATESRPIGVAYGVPDRSQRCVALGNALVPQIAEWIGQQIMNREEGNAS